MSEQMLELGYTDEQITALSLAVKGVNPAVYPCGANSRIMAEFAALRLSDAKATAMSVGPNGMADSLGKPATVDPAHARPVPAGSR